MNCQTLLGWDLYAIILAVSKVTIDVVERKMIPLSGSNVKPEVS